MRRTLTHTGRTLVVAVATAALVTGVAVTPAWASAEYFQAAALREATIADALAAAIASQAASAAHTPEPVEPPVAEVELAPETPAVLDAKAELGTTVEFSGFEVDETLDVGVAPLDDTVASSAASEFAADVLTTPIEVTATTDSGKDVTEFPADPTYDDPTAPDRILLDVDPGVSLSIDVPEAALEGIDPSTVRIVTRENPGDPWVELPSYYDAETGAAQAVSDHLSQFAVIGFPFVAPKLRIVLDPDDNTGWTDGPGGHSEELAYNLNLTNRLAGQLRTMCDADVYITRNDINQPDVPRGDRAGAAAAFNPDITVTVAFNAVYGSPWVTESQNLAAPWRGVAAARLTPHCATHSWGLCLSTQGDPPTRAPTRSTRGRSSTGCQVLSCTWKHSSSITSTTALLSTAPAAGKRSPMASRLASASTPKQSGTTALTR